MKKFLILALSLCLLLTVQVLAEENETIIHLSDDIITVNGQAIIETPGAPVYLARQVETHEDVSPELQGLVNRVITITAAGTYHFSGTAGDAQIAVRAGNEDSVRLILDDIHLTCRTSAAIAVYSAHDPRKPGQYGVTIELAENSRNFITGSHTSAATEEEAEFDGAIGSQVSLGFEGNGQLTVDADNEGVEVAYGHMTINGGTFHITACDDPLNVSEDGVGVLTVNDGFLYSAVKPLAGGEGDGIDSNGSIIFNGGTAINLAHPTSQDGGIDSDMGSIINGGVIVGAGNMYDPIESDSQQLFMMLEFAQETDDLIVVTDEKGNPVFAYDFPYDYMYIAFSTPDLKEGVYHVYLGGEIEGEAQNGLYTADAIRSYVPGLQMKHGEGNAQQRMITPMGGMEGSMIPAPEMNGIQELPANPRPNDRKGMMNAWGGLNLNELLADTDLNELLKGKDLNQLLTGFALTDLLTEEQIAAHLDDADPAMPEIMGGMGPGGMGGNMFGGMGGFRGMASSAEVATVEFVLSRENTGFTNVMAASENP